jgi:hypothetical protein
MHYFWIVSALIQHDHTIELCLLIMCSNIILLNINLSSKKKYMVQPLTSSAIRDCHDDEVDDDEDAYYDPEVSDDDNDLALTQFFVVQGLYCFSS